MEIEEIGLIISVIIFLLSVAFNNYQLYLDRKKTWYMEIIIGSNVDKIDTFFKDIFRAFKKNRAELFEKHEKIDSNYTIDKALKIKELHKIKNIFHFEILPLFKSFDKKLAEDLENALLKFQDSYTENIGIENELKTEKIINELIESKRKFYQVLYSPIKLSFFEKIKLDKALLYFLIILFILFMSKIITS